MVGMEKNKIPSPLSPSCKIKHPRPHTGGKPKKKARDKFRLMAFCAHPEDLAAIRARARAAGLTISAYIRRMAIEKTA